MGVEIISRGGGNHFYQPLHIPFKNTPSEKLKSSSDSFGDSLMRVRMREAGSAAHLNYNILKKEEYILMRDYTVIINKREHWLVKEEIWTG